MGLDFHNTDYFPGASSIQRRRRRFFPRWMGWPALAAAFCLSLALLRAGKLHFSHSNKAGKAGNFQLAAPLRPEGNIREISLPPLLVNLKSAKGPRLAHVHVEIKVRAPAAKKTLLSDRKKLNKYLLFALSGQSAGDLAARKNHFERQIQSQLNTFLPEGPFSGAVEEVSIRAKALN